MESLKGHGEDLLISIESILCRPYPDAAVIYSRVEIGQWMAGIEYLESRLLLALTLTKSHWLKGAKDTSYERKMQSQTAIMTPTHLAQARFMVEQFIANFISKPYDEIESFPFREIMYHLVRFKAKLTDEPMIRRLFQTTASAIKNRHSEKMIRIVTEPQEPVVRRTWYKYHGYYGVLLEAVDFSDTQVKKIPFSMNWLEEDESILVMLFAYVIKSGQQKRRIPSLLLQTEKMLSTSPSVKSIHSAMKAISI
jgi:hypothetical protein